VPQDAPTGFAAVFKGERDEGTPGQTGASARAGANTPKGGHCSLLRPCCTILSSLAALLLCFLQNGSSACCPQFNAPMFLLTLLCHRA
jgi:hypothetical protein